MDEPRLSNFQNLQSQYVLIHWNTWKNIALLLKNLFSKKVICAPFLQSRATKKTLKSTQKLVKCIGGVHIDSTGFLRNVFKQNLCSATTDSCTPNYCCCFVNVGSNLNYKRRNKRHYPCGSSGGGMGGGSPVHPDDLRDCERDGC